MRIVTTYDPPPIPDRSYDWQALDADSYDYDGPLGIGPTEQAAIDDLMEQIEEKNI